MEITKSDKIIEIAEKELGYKETPPNSNKTKYGEWFGFDGVAWCGMFVSWVYATALLPLGNIGFFKGFAGCQTAVKHFKETGEVTESPTSGDIVFFDWNKDGRYDHTGIFYKKLDDTYFESIEGNTSMSNQSNGGEVMKRTRKFSSAIFVHPVILDN